MYIKKNYGFWMTFVWSMQPFFVGLFYGLIVCLISYFLGLHLSIPWNPIGVIGIAVAFYLGFKNNSSYDRTWEARKIWGSIVNNSRTFGAATTSFIQGEGAAKIQKELIYRHIAWLTALRYQLRFTRPWEHIEFRAQGFNSPNFSEVSNEQLDKEIANFISDEEIKALSGKANKATQIMKTQAQRLQELKDQGYYEDFRHMEFHQLIAGFYADQGMSERIKNFPFPRQYASTALWMTFVFSAFVPFGLMEVFPVIDIRALILCPFLSGLIIWVFFLMEKIGDYSENPFEGTYNDIPITSISRAIEIDLREMIQDENIPAPTEAVNGFLM
jgi:ion channel-forming bestrophin family protein